MTLGVSFAYAAIAFPASFSFDLSSSRKRSAPHRATRTSSTWQPSASRSARTTRLRDSSGSKVPTSRTRGECCVTARERNDSMRTPMPVTADGPHLLVTNQHGDNRGDEAALRAMLDGLTSRVPDARFTVVHQFADKEPEIELPSQVELIPMFRSVVDVASLAVFAVLRKIGLRARFVLTP